MALVLDEDQRLIQDTAREFCTANAPVEQLRRLRDAGASPAWDQATWTQMVELGWTGIVIPEARGGTGFGYQALGVILEETGRTLTASPLLSTALIGASAIVLGGDEAQQADLLPRIAGGELTLALALEETPHHAPWQIDLEARADGDDWVLSGSKQFVIDGAGADLLLVVARSAGAAGDRDGISLLLVPSDAEGLSVKPLRMVDSRDAARIEFADVVVPASAVLGAAGSGADLLEAILDRARIGIASEMLGTATEAFERTMAYLKERKQFGELIGSFQALKHRAADMFTELQLARSTVLDALTALDENRDDVARCASLAKAKVGEIAMRITNEAIQMHGGIGMTDEYEIGFYLKRARVQEQSFGHSAFHRQRYAALGGF